MSEKLQARLDTFAYHAPPPSVVASMVTLLGSFRTLAALLDFGLPESREKSLAFTALEESAMWAMKGLALTDADGQVVPP